MSHGADAARDLGGVGDAAEDGGNHVAMFERGGEAGAFFGVVAEPVEQLGPSPLRRVDATAPIDGWELLRARSGCDFGSFAPGAMVAPEVVVVNGLELRVYRDDARAGGVERQRFDCIAVDAG